MKSYRKIRELFDAGQRFRQHPFLVYYSMSIPEPLSHEVELLQMGVSVGTRNFKKAVTRNLLKRRTREAYRKHKIELKEALQTIGSAMSVFFVYTHAEVCEYAEMELAIKSALKKLIKSTIEPSAGKLNN